MVITGVGKTDFWIICYFYVQFLKKKKNKTTGHRRTAINNLFLWAWWDNSHVQAEYADVYRGGLCPDIPFMAILIRQKPFLPTSNGLFSIQSDMLNRYSNSKTQLQGQNLTFQHFFFFRQHFQGVGFKVSLQRNTKY